MKNHSILALRPRTFAAPSTRSVPPETKRVRFSERVKVHEFSLTMGDFDVCRNRPYCAVVCATPLPLVLDQHVRTVIELLDGQQKLPPRRRSYLDGYIHQLDRVQLDGGDRRQAMRTVQEHWLGQNQCRTLLPVRDFLSRAPFPTTTTPFVWTPRDEADNECLRWTSEYCSHPALIPEQVVLYWFGNQNDETNSGRKQSVESYKNNDALKRYYLKKQKGIPTAAKHRAEQLFRHLLKTEPVYTDWYRNKKKKQQQKQKQQVDTNRTLQSTMSESSHSWSKLGDMLSSVSLPSRRSNKRVVLNLLDNNHGNIQNMV